MRKQSDKLCDSILGGSAFEMCWRPFGRVPKDATDSIQSESDLDTLTRWHRLAITATLEQFQASM